MDRIRLASEGKGRLTNKGKIYEYKAIFDMYVKDPKSEDLNIGCNNCVGLSYKQTIGKYERELKEDLKGLDTPLTSWDNNKGTKMTFPKIEPIKVEKEYKIINDVVKADGDTTHLKWGAFKKYCTSKGIPVKGKTRKELEQELKEL